MKWFESIIYGLISGFTEFLPTSSSAHQLIMQQIMSGGEDDAVRKLFVHSAVLIAVILNCKSVMDHFSRIRNQNKRSRANPTNNARIVADYRLIRSAILPMLVCIFVLNYICSGCNNLLWVAVFSFINSVILFVSERLIQGNKDARAMSSFDSFYFGIAGSLAVITGFSRIGTITTASISRGVDRKHALNWALLLSIPALIACLIIDLLAAFNSGIVLWHNFFGYILSGVAAYISGYFSIIVVKFLAIKSRFTLFAYYSFGLALLSFVLYLTVV